MPYCDACAHHWTPTSMRPDGTCPTCGQVLVRPPAGRPPAATQPVGDEEAEAPTTPWHFKLMLLALVIYLAWRAVQGLGWLGAHL